jgi:hypothetical protein
MASIDRIRRPNLGRAYDKRFDQTTINQLIAQYGQNIILPPAFDPLTDVDSTDETNNAIAQIESALTGLEQNLGVGVVATLRRKSDPITGGGTNLLGAAGTDFSSWDRDLANTTLTAGSGYWEFDNTGASGDQALAKAVGVTNGQEYTIDFTLRGVAGGETVYLAAQDAAPAWTFYESGTEPSRTVTLTTSDQTFRVRFTKSANAATQVQAVIGNVNTTEQIRLVSVDFRAVTSAEPVTVENLPTGYRLKTGVITVVGNQITVAGSQIIEVLSPTGSTVLNRVVGRPGEVFEWVDLPPPAAREFPFATAGTALVRLIAAQVFRSQSLYGPGAFSYELLAKGDSTPLVITQPFSANNEDVLRVLRAGGTGDSTITVF